MKLLAFTDVHANMSALREIKKKAKDVDALIDCGDMSLFGTHLKRHLKFLSRIPKPVFVIDGNHEDKDELREACKQFKNITYIDKKIQPFKEAALVGYGGGGFALKDKRFEAYAKKLKPKLKKFEKVVFITHQPPWGVVQDTVIEDEHCGNKSFRRFILDAKPKLVLCGHIHENFNTIDKLGKSAIVNPGPLGRVIKI